MAQKKRKDDSASKADIETSVIQNLVFRPNDGDYFLRASSSLEGLSDCHPAFPYMSEERGSTNGYAIEPEPFLEFVTEACDLQLLQALHAEHAKLNPSAPPFSLMDSRTPAVLKEALESLIPSHDTLFTEEDIRKLEDPVMKSALRELITRGLIAHLTSRQLLLSGTSHISAARVMEGLRRGDVVQTLVHDEPVYAIVTGVSVHHSSSGPRLDVATATLSATVDAARPGISWQVRSADYRLNQLVRVDHGVRVVTEAQFQERSAQVVAMGIPLRLSEAIQRPCTLQLKGDTVGFVKFNRQPEQPVRLSGRVIADVAGWLINKEEHQIELPFHERSHHLTGSLTEDAKSLQEYLGMVGAALGPTIFGYSLAKRIWAYLPLRQLEPVNYRRDLMSKLVIDGNIKQLLSALTQASSSDGDAARDFIEGKHGGNVFLLAGTSGIGKTLTAEATAESLSRPLYRVSAANLGTDPDTIQERLERALANSVRWGAVTLLDEADIFLEQRGPNDIARNAIVGVFLQTLEYFGGVLFITTNRLHNIDEAILPRVSLGFAFPQLDANARVNVWSNLLSMHDHELTAQQVDNLGKYELNGRQIKNIVNMAVTLARAENLKLGLRQITSMATATEEFLEYTRTEDVATS